MIDLQTALALINFGLLIVAIIQLFRQRKDTEHLARVTNNLERELHRLNVELDQDIQRLHRAREALIRFQKAETMRLAFFFFNRNKDYKTSEIPETIFVSYAESDASMSELVGLVQGIGDETLETLVMGLPMPDSNVEVAFEQIKELRKEVAKIHTRIAKLITEATKEKQ